MATKVKWLIRKDDKMVLLSPGGRPIGIWRVEEIDKAGEPDSITVRLERGDDLA